MIEIKVRTHVPCSNFTMAQLSNEIPPHELVEIIAHLIQSETIDMLEVVKNQNETLLYWHLTGPLAGALKEALKTEKEPG